MHELANQQLQAIERYGTVVSLKPINLTCRLCEKFFTKKKNKVTAILTDMYGEKSTQVQSVLRDFCSKSVV